MKMHSMALAVLLGFPVTSPAILAADTATTKQVSPDPTPQSQPPLPQHRPSRRVSAAYQADKDQLKKALGTGHDKASYRPALEKIGIG